jgi:hypothetical protein
MTSVVHTALRQRDPAFSSIGARYRSGTHALDSGDTMVTNWGPGGITWISVVRQHRVPLWSWPLIRTSTEVNTVGTLFILPFVTTLLATAAVWRELSTGRLAPLPASSIGLLARLPGSRVRRGIQLGAACLAVLAPGAVALVAGTRFGDISRGDFVVFQTVFTVCFGAVVTPLVALRAMADGERAADSLTGQPTAPMLPGPPQL